MQGEKITKRTASSLIADSHNISGGDCMRGKLRAAGECDERATVQSGARSRNRKAVKREAALAKVAQRHALQQLGRLFQLRLPLYTEFICNTQNCMYIRIR